MMVMARMAVCAIAETELQPTWNLKICRKDVPQTPRGSESYWQLASLGTQIAASLQVKQERLPSAPLVYA